MFDTTRKGTAMQFVGRIHLRTYPDHTLIKTEAIKIDAATAEEAHDKLIAELARRNQQAGAHPEQLWFAAKDAIHASRPGSVSSLMRRHNSRAPANQVSPGTDQLPRHQTRSGDAAGIRASASIQRLGDACNRRTARQTVLPHNHKPRKKS